MFIYKNEFTFFQKIIIVINSFGILILRLICLSQFDIKSIIAVSSIVHIGLTIIRIIAFFNIRIIGIYLIIISHGLRSSGLIFTNKGIINFIPRISLYLSRQITSPLYHLMSNPYTSQQISIKI